MVDELEKKKIVDENNMVVLRLRIEFVWKFYFGNFSLEVLA